MGGSHAMRHRQGDASVVEWPLLLMGFFNSQSVSPLATIVFGCADRMLVAIDSSDFLLSHVVFVSESYRSKRLFFSLSEYVLWAVHILLVMHFDMEVMACLWPGCAWWVPQR